MGLSENCVLRNLRVLSEVFALKLPWIGVLRLLDKPKDGWLSAAKGYWGCHTKITAWMNGSEVLPGRVLGRKPFLFSYVSLVVYISLRGWWFTLVCGCLRFPRNHSRIYWYMGIHLYYTRVLRYANRLVGWWIKISTDMTKENPCCRCRKLYINLYVFFPPGDIFPIHGCSHKIPT